MYRDSSLALRMTVGGGKNVTLEAVKNGNHFFTALFNGFLFGK